MLQLVINTKILQVSKLVMMYRVYAGAKILGNISIGSNVIVGSNTVVTKNIEDNFLVHSNPNILVIPSDHQKGIMI